MRILSFDEDLLGLKPFAERLENFIRVEHRYVSESLVISLNGGFGTGKTTFLKMWIDHIKKNSPSNKTLVVEVNAWNDDYCGDPFVSLVSALIESLDQKDPNAKSLCNAAKDVGWFITGIGSQIVNKLTGIDPFSAGEIAEKKKIERDGEQAYSTTYFEIFKAKKGALHTLKDSIRKIIDGDNPSILILVDELDRCRPDYAISYLETIKHIFDIHGIVFILAVDRKQLECSAKAAFGLDLDFPEYYRKFVHREVMLPTPDEKSYRTLVERYIGYYLNRENERYCFMQLDVHRVENIIELICSMKMTPRQVQEVFRIMGHVLETDKQKKGQLFWCLGVGTILMSALRLGNLDIYQALGRQDLSVQKAAAFFKNLVSDNAEWWFTLCLTGGGLNSEDIKNKELADIYRNAGFAPDEVESKFISQWQNGWGRSHKGRFKEIHSKIEHISSWN